ncbi:MAG: hypothetical protein MUF00_17595 [Gemmatimonadaceae bacterium]|nr:hypothetical protein [Gemmatimonadaceae bacterium]
MHRRIDVSSLLLQLVAGASREERITDPQYQVAHALGPQLLGGVVPDLEHDGRATAPHGAMEGVKQRLFQRGHPILAALIECAALERLEISGIAPSDEVGDALKHERGASCRVRSSLAGCARPDRRGEHGLIHDSDTRWCGLGPGDVMLRHRLRRELVRGDGAHVADDAIGRVRLQQFEGVEPLRIDTEPDGEEAITAYGVGRVLQRDGADDACVLQLLENGGRRQQPALWQIEHRLALTNEIRERRSRDTTRTGERLSRFLESSRQLGDDLAKLVSVGICHGALLVTRSPDTLR